MIRRDLFRRTIGAAFAPVVAKVIPATPVPPQTLGEWANGIRPELRVNSLFKHMYVTQELLDDAGGMLCPEGFVAAIEASQARHAARAAARLRCHAQVKAAIEPGPGLDRIIRKIDRRFA